MDVGTFEPFSVLPRCLKDAGIKTDAAFDQILIEVWYMSGCFEPALYASIGTISVLLEDKDVLQLNHVTFNAYHLGDIGDASASAGEAGLLHDDVNGGTHLLSNRLNGQVQATHQSHHLKSREAISWGVGVRCGQ